MDWSYFLEDWNLTDCGAPSGSSKPPNDCECDMNYDFLNANFTARIGEINLKIDIFFCSFSKFIIFTVVR